MDSQRIDKWLWAARFYKTRALATDEINKGRVKLNGQPVKPAKEIHPKDVIHLQQGTTPREVVVLGLSNQRGSAPQAQLLYQETSESITLRETLATQRRLAPEPALTMTQGRPTKRERRSLQDLQPWNERWSAQIPDA